MVYPMHLLGLMRPLTKSGSLSKPCQIGFNIFAAVTDIVAKVKRVEWRRAYAAGSFREDSCDTDAAKQLRA